MSLVTDPWIVVGKAAQSLQEVQCPYKNECTVTVSTVPLMSMSMSALRDTSGNFYSVHVFWCSFPELGVRQT